MRRFARPDRARRMVCMGLASLTILVLPGLLHADSPPNGWDVAKNPAARDRWDLHEEARQAMALEQDQDLGRLRDASLERERAVLEDAGAANSPDVRLRFDLGEIYETLKLHDRAVAVLEPACKEAPDHPAATQAWVMLAYAYAYLDRTRPEIGAYEKYLAKETDDRLRVTAMLNMAEAQMRLGDLEDAVAGYRETIALALSLPFRQGSNDEVLGTWGLAVALDRSGDPADAAVTARQATQIDPAYRLIDNRDFVFFVPAYDRYWYLALGHTEDAKHAPTARRAVREWHVVEELWSLYVAEAVPQDHWLPLARAHLERAHVARVAAEKRAKTESGKGPLRDDDEVLIR
jgi:tetratricopeptide (TPR) repeat protein